MSIKKKSVKFIDWSVIPSDIDGIEIVFSYNVFWIENEGKPEEKKVVKENLIKTGVSGSRAITWNFQIWQFNRPHYYDNLAKILFEYAKRHIIKKIKEGTLKEIEQFMLLTTNSPAEIPFNPDKIEDPKGAVFEIEFSSEESLEKMLNHNTLAADIIEKRDAINAIFHDKYGEKLFKLDEERRILDLFKSANSSEEFSHRITSLGGLVGQMNKDIIKTIIEPATPQNGTINYLESFLNKINCETENIIIPLRTLNRLRQSYPVHTDLAGTIDSLKFFGIDYPIENYKKSWEKLLNEYNKVLANLIQEIKDNLLKK